MSMRPVEVQRTVNDAVSHRQAAIRLPYTWRTDLALMRSLFDYAIEAGLCGEIDKDSNQRMCLLPVEHDTPCGWLIGKTGEVTQTITTGVGVG